MLVVSWKARVVDALLKSVPDQCISLLMTNNNVRDWSLIMGRGGYEMGKSWVRNILRPPQDRVKLLVPPFKKWKLFEPLPFNMAKISSSPRKNYPKTCCAPPPFSMAKTFSAPPPFFCRGKTSHAPPSRSVAPPPPLPPRNH